MTKINKDKIYQLISSGQTGLALEELLSTDIPAKEKSIVIQIKASFENLSRNYIRGEMTFDQQNIEQNKINSRILDFLEKNDEPIQPQLIEKKSTKSKMWEYVIGIGVIMGILGGIAEFSGCNLRDLIFSRNNNNETFTVTVFVHGKKGKDDRILKNQGQIFLGLRTNEMPCSINEKGEATFKEIPLGFNGERVPIRLEHPQPYRATHQDSTYMLEPNAAIYLEVALEGINRVFGKVIDNKSEKWLDSVRVSIENFATYTDSFGWFELTIPEDKQKKFQRISFFKKGYQIEELDSIPVHIQKEIQISLKKDR